MRLLRLMHWKARARYWKQRAQRAERLLQEMQEALEAERDRNREREDTFVSASIMGQRGMWGVPARTGPVRQPVPLMPSAPRPVPNSWDSLSWADKNEFEMFWKPDAESAGVSMQQAQREFIEKVIIPRRNPLNEQFN